MSQITKAIEERVGPRPAGGDWPCPFCQRYGQLGILAVRVEPPTFYCATCGHGGDAVKFVAMFDRISLVQAEGKLAQPVAPKVYEAPDVVTKPRWDMLKSKMEKASTS